MILIIPRNSSPKPSQIIKLIPANRGFHNKMIEIIIPRIPKARIQPQCFLPESLISKAVTVYIIERKRSQNAMNNESNKAVRSGLPVSNTPRKKVIIPPARDQPQFLRYFLFDIEKIISTTPEIKNTILRNSAIVSNAEMGVANTDIPSPMNNIPRIKGIYQNLLLPVG